MRGETKTHNTAILLAAGDGRRMGGAVKKQYLELQGKALFLHALNTISRHRLIDAIILVVSAGDEAYCRERAEEAGLAEKIRAVVRGGSERYASVACGLAAIDWPCDYVWIHDSARPLLDAETIDRLYEAVTKDGAAVGGVPSKDTVNLVDAEGFAEETPARDRVWIVQTPQVFSYALIKKAHEALREAQGADPDAAREVTDDAMIVAKYAGVRAKMVKASYRNIKVTTPEDLAIAENLGRDRR